MEIQQDKKRNIPALVPGVVAILLIAATVILFSLLRVTPKSDIYVMELGASPSGDISDYLEGKDFVLKYGIMESENLDRYKAGEYTIYWKVFYQKIPFTIVVKDTVPPVLTLKKENLCMEVGREYPITAFYDAVEDLSGDVTVSFAEKNGKQKVIFKKRGKYSITIQAKDASGNTTEKKMRITTDTGPELVGVRSRQIRSKSDWNRLENIVAVDLEDGDLSEQIKVRKFASGHDTDSSFYVIYSVADSHGFETGKLCRIKVNAKKKYRQEDDFVLSEEEISVLCENNYFIYEPLVEENYEQTMALIEPTLIDIYRAGDNFSWVAGSGFIYEISPEYIYFGSVEHVLQSMNNEADITFFNGDKIREPFSFEYVSPENELAMFRIETKEIPSETLLQLKEIYVDEDIYKKTRIKTEIMSFATHWCGSDEDAIEKLEIKRMLDSDYFQNHINCVLVAEGRVKGGMSGTATVDLRGNLLGTVSSYSEGQNLSYHTRIDEIDDLRERFNNK